MSTHEKIDAIRQSISVRYTDLQQVVDEQLTRVDPALLYRVPEPGEWTIMENLAHVVEFLTYWADEFAKVVAHPGSNFGRTQQHEGRLGALSEHGRDTLEQVRDALPRSYSYLEQVLATFQDSDLALTGIHPRYGEQTLEWFINDFVTVHLSDHREQMQADLARLQAV